MLPFEEGEVVYTAAGISFVRTPYSYGDPLWFEDPPIFSKEPLLGGGVFRDVAGVAEGELSFQARFETVEERDALVNRAGTAVTLTTSTGRSRTVVLTRALPVQITAFIPGALVTFA